MFGGTFCGPPCVATVQLLYIGVPNTGRDKRGRNPAYQKWGIASFDDDDDFIGVAVIVAVAAANDDDDEDENDDEMPIAILNTLSTLISISARVEASAWPSD